ncbi:PGG domain-containing protein [Heracleum sosnowskyi]|uniref:PGG domain-containing protein n=1 Tax=Heracleum sosnowskyi TaxID=360622 RepID=A0AAD8J2W1_9APIA|nr:PGG domain-containing protein [Heracleum sosnowskyi]
MESIQKLINEAAEEGDIEILYHSIGKEPYILENIDEIPFVDTPLHIAAKAGKTSFTIEMMRLKPSFSRKLNPEGYSPIHLAVKWNQQVLVKRMINIDRELVRVQGKECNTPLHCAAENGYTDLVLEFLLACPESILDVNAKKKSALHIAVKANKFDTVKVMLEWLKLLDAEFVLGWTDEDGNSILHIAASETNVEMIKFLIPKMDMYARNSVADPKSAYDIIKAQTPDLLPKDKIVKMIHWLSRGKSHYNATLYCDTNNNTSLKDSLKEGYPWYKRWILSNHRHISLVDKNGVLVVAVLIATTAYQAIVQLPSIFRPGVIDFASHYFFFIFQLFNTTAFIAAMSLIFILLPPGITYVLQLIIPIIVCYFVGLYLSNLETGLFMFSLFFFLWQFVRFGRTDRNGRRERHFLLKHSASFSKELERKGYKYETAI